jgi:lysophospholipase L1-like esterase
VKIFAWVVAGSVLLVLPLGYASVAAESLNGKQITLVCFGDSTTAPRGPLRVYADCLKDDFAENGIQAEIINAGAGGNTTDDARLRFDRDVLDRRPNLAVIQFGINDSAIDVWKHPPSTEPRVTIEQYVRNLEHFADALQAAKCEVILMTPNPVRWTSSLKLHYGKPPYRPDDPDGFNGLLGQYAEAVRRLAQKRKLPVVDVYAAFEAYGHDKNHSMDDLLLDGMHPNAKGQRLVADLLIGEILKFKASGTEQRN